MTYPIKRTVYKGADGTVTHDSNQGKNEPVFVSGAIVSLEVATKLGLPDLDKATEAAEAKAADPFAELKAAPVFVPEKSEPAATSVAATEPKAEEKAEPKSKAAKSTSDTEAK